MAEQMQKVSYGKAIQQATLEEMRRDDRVVVWGEDLVSMQGAFMETPGIYEEFGEDRIKDTPITENAIVQTAMGAALTGLRPIAYLMFAGFATLCLDTMVYEMGGLRQEFGYDGPMPLVINMRSGIGGGTGAHHCGTTEAYLLHSAGLKIAMPSTAYDAKGLYKTAIRDDDPVIFITHGASSFGPPQEIPVKEYLIPFGQADIKREGNDVTIVAYAGMVSKSLKAAETLSKEGINVEIVDLRTLVPLDVETIAKSVSKTGRLLIAHEAQKRGGPAGEIAMRVIEAAPDVMTSLKAPIKRVAALNLALPYDQALTAACLPQVDDVVKAVKEMA